MGGRAFDNVVPVPQETILKICAWVSTLFELRDESYDSTKFEDFCLGLMSSMKGFSPDTIGYLHELFVKNGLRTLGSTGKKLYCGDVDIGVSDAEWTYSSLVDFLTIRFGSDNIKTNESLNQIYTRVYVPSSGWHQVDYMLGDVRLLEFTHWSPAPDTSLYSGSHRTELIKAVAKALSSWTWVMPSDCAYNNGEMIARIGYTLNHDRGLVHGARYAPARIDGRGYTKKMVPVTAANIVACMRQVSDAHSCNYLSEVEMLSFFRHSVDEILTKTSVDPVFISQQLFGIGVMPESLNSYEQVVEAIMANSELCNLRDLIWQLYVERLMQIGQPIPSPGLNDLFIFHRVN
jgi:hypothetical protein